MQPYPSPQQHAQAQNLEHLRLLSIFTTWPGESRG